MADDLAEELRRNVPLSEMIQTLRHELAVALGGGRDSPIRFAPKKVELELHIAVSRELGAEGKLRLGVVTAGTSAGRTQADTHVFRLELEPLLLAADGTREPFTISERVDDVDQGAPPVHSR